LANIKSAIKRNKQNEKRRLRNRVFRGRARTFVKKAKFEMENGNQEAAETTMNQAISALDKAAEKGILHRNNAARRKSRLVQQYKKTFKQS
jgi:small subunit ribosomal protein S20